MNGEGWAISQVADRIDGRPKQESDFSIASTRYLIEAPAQLSREEWEREIFAAGTGRDEVRSHTKR
jgi:hypothetical protein